MPKGKKFDAAEKHFEKKRQEYENTIKRLNNTLKESRAETIKYKTAYENVIGENEQLKAWIERLLEYTELSIEDIKEACEKDKQMGEAAKMLTGLMKFTGSYF